MMPATFETVSALEVVRAVVALFGLAVSMRGRALAMAQRMDISDVPSDDSHVRREREQRDDRMGLFTLIQTSISAVHAMLLGNALVQMAFPSPSIENLNVLVSNVTQVLIPLILARASEHVSLQMRTATRLHVVTGPRDTTEGDA